MAFVDTAALPDRVRRETTGRRAVERLGRQGVLNTCEAVLLARLAAFYHRRGAEWVVIVPYLAQRAEVIGHLTPLIGDSQLAASSVGSVDSYQGGEREVVLYGFTRSNSQGRIGFLKELRRANVAFTRAKSQLVMTGDLGTLLRADDPGFRALAEQLHRHLRERGELRDYQDVMDALDAVARTRKETVRDHGSPPDVVPRGACPEDAAFGQGIAPTRLYALLLPVWEVEVRADITEGEDFFLIDRFLERGLRHGGLRTVDELATFFALDRALVAQAVRFLTAIGHLQESSGHLS
ncbi:AAA domain-containing protein [Streptomyces sp. M19]